MNRIPFLTRKQIDTTAWNQAVDRSSSGLPYAYSWYLDLVTDKKWGALVKGDYKQVCPLPWNRKLMGLPQVYQPPFSQQLGVFGADLDWPQQEAFMQAIPRQFQKVHLMLHAYDASGLPKNTRWKTNLVLPLNRSYEAIQADFSKSLRKRVRQASTELELRAQGSVESLVAFYRGELEAKVGLSAKSYQRARQLFQELLNRQMGEIYQVYDQKDQLVCTGLFVKTDRRVINLFGASNARGRETYAMHFLLAMLIRRYAGQDLLFDFEGSEIPGVAQFFHSFGAVEQPFFAYQRDTLMSRGIHRLKNGLIRYLVTPLKS